jgi:hypothetical protein
MTAYVSGLSILRHPPEGRILVYNKRGELRGAGDSRPADSGDFRLAADQGQENRVWVKYGK